MKSANKEILTTRIVEALPVPDRDTVFWDRELPGFGVRLHPSGSKVYIVHKRFNGKSRRVTIGSHEVWSLDAARREAGSIIASLKAGQRPNRPGTDAPAVAGPTIAALAERYMTEHVALRCKPTTERSCRNILDRYLLPQFGTLRFGEITPDRVADLHYKLRATPTMANQVIDMLSRLFHMARKTGHAPDSGNPCRFIKKYPPRSCDRFLSEQEFLRLGAALRELEGEGKITNTAAAALRLLMLTGCRRNEIVTLKWEDVDFEHDEFRLRPTPRPEDAWFPCRPRRGRSSPPCPASPATRGSFRGARRAAASAISTQAGGSSARRRSWRTCGFMTSDTPLPRGVSPWAKACR